MQTTYLKSALTTASKWPTWKKWTYGFIAFAIINGIVNPAPKPTAEQIAAKAAQEVAREAESAQEKRENEAVFMAHQWVKENLNDPDSVEWKGTFVYKNLDVCVNFSAKNGFNGRVKGYAALIDGVMTMNNLKAWNKRCGDSGAVRYY